MIKAILFDFGGTLDSDGETWLERFHSIYKGKGGLAPRETFDRAFYDSDDALPTNHNLKTLSLRDTVTLQVQGVLASLAPEKPALTSEIVDRFLSDCRAHFRRNRPILERLSLRFKLGIVSNWYGNLESVLEGEGLRSLFGAVADSGVVGTAKPDPKIFLTVTSALGINPSDCLMVGDSIKRDMRGAEGLAMPHAWIASKSGSPCCAQAWTLGSLTELEGRLSAKEPLAAKETLV